MTRNPTVDRMIDDEKLEQAHEDGSRAVWCILLAQCLTNLGHAPEAAPLILERERTIGTLRRLCSDYGDNDWPSDLHMADIIEKHLVRPMLKAQERGER